jgi:hypothetical protein
MHINCFLSFATKRGTHNNGDIVDNEYYRWILRNFQFYNGILMDVSCTSFTLVCVREFLINFTLRSSSVSVRVCLSCLFSTLLLQHHRSIMNESHWEVDKKIFFFFCRLFAFFSIIDNGKVKFYFINNNKELLQWEGNVTLNERWVIIDRPSLPSSAWKILHFEENSICGMRNANKLYKKLW